MSITNTYNPFCSIFLLLLQLSGRGLYTKSEVRVSGVLKHYSNFFIVVVKYIYHHMPCLVAIADCTRVHSIVHYTNIITYHIILLLLSILVYTALSTNKHTINLVATVDSTQVSYSLPVAQETPSTKTNKQENQTSFIQF